jgi:hypothetical protein
LGRVLASHASARRPQPSPSGAHEGEGSLQRAPDLFDGEALDVVADLGILEAGELLAEEAFLLDRGQHAREHAFGALSD